MSMCPQYFESNYPGIDSSELIMYWPPTKDPDWHYLTEWSYEFGFSWTTAGPPLRWRIDADGSIWLTGFGYIECYRFPTSPDPVEVEPVQSKGDGVLRLRKKNSKVGGWYWIPVKDGKIVDPSEWLIDSDATEAEVIRHISINGPIPFSDGERPEIDGSPIASEVLRELKGEFATTEFTCKCGCKHLAIFAAESYLERHDRRKSETT